MHGRAVVLLQPRARRSEDLPSRRGERGTIASPDDIDTKLPGHFLPNVANNSPLPIRQPPPERAVHQLDHIPEEARLSEHGNAQAAEPTNDGTLEHRRVRRRLKRGEPRDLIAIAMRGQIDGITQTPQGFPVGGLAGDRCHRCHVALPDLRQ